MVRKYKIIDTTLREGEQAPGVMFTLEQKKKIIDLLVHVGVAEIELGVSSPLADCTMPLLKYCRSNYPDMRLSLWSRCREEDIRFASILMPDILSLSIPVSEIHLTKKMVRDRSWAEKVMQDSIDLTRRLGMEASVGFEDATRADPVFLGEMALLAEKAGASRLRLADTVGVASPGRIAQLMSEMRTNLSTCELAIHTHNDFGMATANAVAAFEAGAIWADATVLGLGERAGCAKLEELVGYIALVQKDPDLYPTHLRCLTRYVADITGRNISGHKPIIGEDIFTCETGLHLQGLQKDPQTYEPYNPESVGGRRKMLFGAKSGRVAVLQEIYGTGGEATGKNIETSVIKAIRQSARKLRRPLTEVELRAHFKSR